MNIDEYVVQMNSNRPLPEDRLCRARLFAREIAELVVEEIWEPTFKHFYLRQIKG